MDTDEPKGKNSEDIDVEGEMTKAEEMEEKESYILDEDSDEEDEFEQDDSEDELSSEEYWELMHKMHEEYLKEVEKEDDAKEEPLEEADLELEDEGEEMMMEALENQDGNEMLMVEAVHRFRGFLEKVYSGKTPKKWLKLRRPFVAFLKVIVDQSQTFHLYFPDSPCDAELDKKNLKYIRYFCTRIKKLRCFPLPFRRLCELMLYPTRCCSSIEELMSAFKQVSRNLRTPKSKKNAKQTKKVKMNRKLEENKVSEEKQSAQAPTTAGKQCTGESTPKRSPLLTVQAAAVNVNNDTTTGNNAIDGNDELALADVKTNTSFLKSVSTQTQLSLLDTKTESVGTQTSNKFALTQEKESPSPSVSFTQEPNADATAKHKRGKAVTLPKQD